MTNPETRTTKPPPLWALALGVVVVIGGMVFLVQLLAEQVQAFALDQPGSGSGAGSRLLWPAVAGQLLLTLAVWFALSLAFRTSWKRRRGQLYVWLGVLLAASMITFTGTLIYAVKSARLEAVRAAAEIDRREQAAIDRTVALFPDARDADLAAFAFREMRGWADPISDIRDTRISRDPNGDWVAVCGQVSINGGPWAGFVTRSIDGGPLRAALEQDGFDEARRKTCRPLAMKYLGIRGVDVKAYMAERDALGCTDIDINYWTAWKAYCPAEAAGAR